MFKVSDIMEKEVVNVNNGKKLGFINDIELDINEGKIRSLIIFDDSGRMSLLRGGESHAIFWENIIKIGCDTILVDLKSSTRIEEVDM